MADIDKRVDDITPKHPERRLATRFAPTRRPTGRALRARTRWCSSCGATTHSTASPSPFVWYGFFKIGAAGTKDTEGRRSSPSVTEPGEPALTTHDAAQSAGAARHRRPARTGLAPGTRGGRFGRMFGFLPQRDPGDEAIEALVRAAPAREADGAATPRSPPGYTYLGQFVDHDITFDPTSKLERDNDPQALVNFRTPRFDLDSLYGSGPQDQPFLYDWDCDARGREAARRAQHARPRLTDADDVRARSTCRATSRAAR